MPIIDTKAQLTKFRDNYRDDIKLINELLERIENPVFVNNETRIDKESCEQTGVDLIAAHDAIATFYDLNFDWAWKAQMQGGADLNYAVTKELSTYGEDFQDRLHAATEALQERGMYFSAENIGIDKNNPGEWHLNMDYADGTTLNIEAQEGVMEANQFDEASPAAQFNVNGKERKFYIDPTDEEILENEIDEEIEVENTDIRSKYGLDTFDDEPYFNDDDYGFLN